MILGEPQILGQIKTAYGYAAEFKTAGLILNRFLHKAFSVAKRVRTETAIASNAVSVSFAAVEMARAIAIRFRREQEGGGKSVIVDASVPDDVDYARLRRDHFERERTRLGMFRLKNLEYVMRREEGGLRRTVECMDRMTEYEERLQLQKELQDRQRRELRMRLEEREIRRECRGIANDGGGGVGTMEQRRAARAREARQLDDA